MTVRTFALILGGIMIAVGVGFLAFPVTVDYTHSETVACGNGMDGIGMSPELRDAGSDVAEAITGYHRERPHTRVELCESAIGHRQIVGWPLLAVGGVTLLGAMFIEPRATTPRHPEVLPGSAP